MKIIGKVFILLAIVALLVVPVVGCPGEQITSEEFNALVAKVDILVQQQLDTDAKITALDARVENFVTQQLTLADAEIAALLAQVGALEQQLTWADTEIAALLTQLGALGQELTWYEDSDGDGFGNPDVSQVSGDQPDHYVANSSDCDDDDPTVHPGAPEIPGDGVDNDCNPATPD